jgi:hypothetical protein
MGVWVVCDWFRVGRGACAMQQQQGGGEGNGRVASLFRQPLRIGFMVEPTVGQTQSQAQSHAEAFSVIMQRGSVSTGLAQV